MSDRLVLSVYYGSIAALAANTFLFILNSLIPGPRINMPQLTVQLFIEQVEFTLFVVILGVIWSMIVGGVYAFVYLLMLDYTGWNNLQLKAVAVVSGMWLLGAGPIMKMLDIFPAAREAPLPVAAFFVAHLFFALVLSYMASNVNPR